MINPYTSPSVPAWCYQYPPLLSLWGDSKWQAAILKAITPEQQKKLAEAAVACKGDPVLRFK